MLRVLSYRCRGYPRACRALVLLVVLLLAACSGRNKATPMPATTAAPLPTRAPATLAPKPTVAATATQPQVPPDLPTSAEAFFNQARQAKDQKAAVLVPDYPSGLMAFPTNKGFDPRGGDAYVINVYERPFSPQTQDTFFPDLDITLAALVQQGDWYIAGLRLFGLRPDAKGPQGDYALELDLDRDGRGDLLVRAKGPLTANQWQQTNVEVRRDANRDVEGKEVCGSDAPFQGDGYETVVYDGAKQAQGLAWAMWTWSQPDAQARPVVFIAVHRSLLQQVKDGFLWQAWADGGVRDPQRMVFHDAYTLEQAGEPYIRSPYFPIKSVAEVDSTCRAAFGFDLTGDEPCLCTGENMLPKPVRDKCEQVPEPPYDVCMQSTSKPDIWVCFLDESESIECVWDANACEWNCGNTCVVEEAFEEAGCTLNPDGSAVCEEAGVQTEYAPDECVVLMPGCFVTCETQQEGGAACESPDACTESFDGTWLCPDGEWQTCEYDGCGWTCEGLISACESPDLCQEQADSTWVCSDIPEATWEDCYYDGCWWNCQMAGDVCEPADQCIYDQVIGMWNCGDEYLWDVCEYDGCNWVCTNIDPGCEDPYACWFDDDFGSWTCEDGSFWDSCNYDGCYWTCEGGDGGNVCDTPDACWYDSAGGYWSCIDGSEWATCDYDGCYWYCEGAPAYCDSPDACWYDDITDSWSCIDGSEWATCDYDGCYWYCEGEAATCEPDNFCTYDDTEALWFCDDGYAYNECSYDGCTWSCQ